MMNDFSVIFCGGNYSESGSLLKIVNQASNEEFKISHCFSDFTRLCRNFSLVALDLVYLALATYGCDRAVSRANAEDRWTRHINLTLPVGDLAIWAPLERQISEMISFLTGDCWVITFKQRTIDVFGKEYFKDRRKMRKRTQITGNVTSLFSGGLDSFIGAIDWLESNPGMTLTLSGAYDPQAEGAGKDQERLFGKIQQIYPRRTKLFTSRMGIREQGNESSYRSRSFCFIAFGILASTFQSNGTLLLIPENGPIALNYPLSPARYGSSSTRTVHPYFLSLLQAVLCKLGLTVKLSNPYRLHTKGEMVANCRNQGFLRNTYSLSISCGNRKRFKTQVNNRSAEQCGFCVPCLFRRAALSTVGLDNEKYGAFVEDPATWGSAKLNEPNKNFFDICDFVRSNESDRTIRRRIIANGRLDSNIASYVHLVIRQRTELQTWLNKLGIL